MWPAGQSPDLSLGLGPPGPQPGPVRPCGGAGPGGPHGAVHDVAVVSKLSVMSIVFFPNDQRKFT